MDKMKDHYMVVGPDGWGTAPTELEAVGYALEAHKEQHSPHTSLGSLRSENIHQSVCVECSEYTRKNLKVYQFNWDTTRCWLDEWTGALCWNGKDGHAGEKPLLLVTPENSMITYAETSEKERDSDHE